MHHRTVEDCRGLSWNFSTHRYSDLALVPFDVRLHFCDCQPASSPCIRLIEARSAPYPVTCPCIVAAQCRRFWKRSTSAQELDHLPELARFGDICALLFLM